MTDIPLSSEQLSTLKTWVGSGSINIFGLPFAGKDTHGSILATSLNASLLGGGDILRNSIIPPELKKELDAGKLFPTVEYMRIVTPYLSQSEFEGRPLILSSVGRWIGEEEGVIKATEASNHSLKAVIYLQLSEKVVHGRWKRSQAKGDRGNRADDAGHKLDTRIQEFKTKTLPVIEVYRQKGLLIEVNSEAKEDEVTETIFARLLMEATQ